MRDAKVAVRYAEALLEAARRQDQIDGVAESFAALMQAVAGQRELRTFLESPQVPTQDKKGLLRRVLADHVEPLLLHFVELLLDKDRLFYIRDIQTQFARLVEIERGVQRAVVTTAVPLAEDLAAKLQEKLAQMTGKRIVLVPRTNPAVIGGVSVTMGDQIIDGTVRTGLEELRHQLGKAPLR